MPAGKSGLPPWPDFLVRLTRLPVASIALIRGRATGNGSEITLSCDMSLASREKAIISQWEAGVGMVPGGGSMARLPQLIGRNRALEVLLSSEDIRGEQAEAYGYINRALPDAELDAYVEALATRISKFDKWAIANIKRLVNTSLAPDVEMGASSAEEAGKEYREDRNLSGPRITPSAIVLRKRSPGIYRNWPGSIPLARAASSN